MSGVLQSMVRWHHQPTVHVFEQTPGDSKEQRCLVCCSPWLDSITNPTSMSLSKLQEIARSRDVWRAAVHGVSKNQTRLSD